MKLKKVTSQLSNGYPAAKFVYKNGMKSLVVGASITASLILAGCSAKKKQGDQSPTLPNDNTNAQHNSVVDGDKPPEKGNSTEDNTKKPKIIEVHKMGEIRAPRNAADRDNDGIPDADDKCPDDSGPKRHNGCPVIITRGVIVRPHKP